MGVEDCITSEKPFASDIENQRLREKIAAAEKELSFSLTAPADGRQELYDICQKAREILNAE